MTEAGRGEVEMDMGSRNQNTAGSGSGAGPAEGRGWCPRPQNQNGEWPGKCAWRGHEPYTGAPGQPWRCLRDGGRTEPAKERRQMVPSDRWEVRAAQGPQYLSLIHI